MLARMAKREPVEQGGWSLLLPVTWGGAFHVDPAASSYPLRANGAAASTGWRRDTKLEALRNQWFDTGRPGRAEAGRPRHPASGLQQLAPTSPLGEWFNPMAHRTNLSGFVRSPYGLFWNVRAS